MSAIGRAVSRSVSRSVGRGVRFVVSDIARAIRALFATAEQGLWLDPSDVVEYTASKGPELAGELTTNAGTVTYVNGVATYTEAATSAAVRNVTLAVPGRVFEFKFRIVSISGGSIRPYAGTSSNGGTYTTPGEYTVQVLASGGPTLSLTALNVGTTPTTAVVDRISIRELTGIDRATMFQDAAGTTPVTAVGQPVGLILDKRKGAIFTDKNVKAEPLISELTVSAGAIINVSTPSDTLHQQWIEFQNNTVSSFAYLAPANPSRIASVTLDVEMLDTDTPPVLAGDGIANNGALVVLGVAIAPTITKLGPFRYRLSHTRANFTSAINNCGFIVYAGNTFRPLRISGFVIKELVGNHASQTTAASRPVLQGDITPTTELIANGSFDAGGAGWTDISTGGGSVTFTGGVATLTRGASGGPIGKITQKVNTVAGKTYELSLLVAGNPCSPTVGSTSGAANILSNVSAGVGVSTHQFVATGAEAWISANSSVLNSAPTVDNISVQEFVGYFRYYLAFDGIDDFLVTPSIDFTGTDKMTVVAGVRNSGSAVSTFVELSANANASNGSFAILPSISVDAVALRYRALGTPSIFGDVTGALPINTNRVLAGRLDLSQLTQKLRSNTTETATTVDTGVNNFGNYPLYIGRRGGTSLPFNGRIYSLVVRGALTDAAGIVDAEKYAALKTGVDFNAPVVAAPAPVNTLSTGAPAINDTSPYAGQVLTASAGTIADADGLGTISYQWQDGTGTTFANIAGATAANFTVTTAQLNKQLRVVASFVDGKGFSESRTSATTDVILEAKNLLKDSEALLTAEWSRSATVAAVAGAVTVDGHTGTAFTVQDSVTNARHATNQPDPLIDAVTPIYGSVYMKKTTGAITGYPGIFLQSSGGTTQQVGIIVNPNTGTFVKRSDSNGTNDIGIIDAGTHWRIWVKIQPITGNTTFNLFLIPAMNADGGAVIDTTGTGIYEFFGPAVSQTAELRPYVKTTTTAI